MTAMINLSVPDMSCGHCEATVKTTVAGVDSEARVNIDLQNRTVSIESASNELVLIDALKAEGYPASVI